MRVLLLCVALGLAGCVDTFARRDDAKCRAKYGADWEAYCGKVPWRILPGVY